MTTDEKASDHSRDLRALTLKVDQLSSDVHDLVEAWNAARGIVKFVRTVGSIATACAAVWVIFKMAVIGGVK